FSLVILPTPRSTLFPYTTLFRSLGKKIVANKKGLTGKKMQSGPLINRSSLADRTLDYIKRRCTIPSCHFQGGWEIRVRPEKPIRDRKSTRLNSSHLVISYAVFCL